MIHLKSLGRIVQQTTMQRIKENAETVKDLIERLKNELNSVNSQYETILAKELREENAKLEIAIEDAKKRLVNLEVKNGIQQVPLPNQSAIVQGESSEPAKDEPKEPAKKAKAEPKPKKEKKPKEATQDVSDSAPVDIGRLDLRIAKIVDVKRHPDADTLYLLQVACGEDKPRTVCSGLVKHVEMDSLKDRAVMLLCNLKPVKMRGISSEAMVMCASTEQKVEVLLPPANAVPGEHVHCEGFERRPDAVMNPKKKIFETVAPDLHTDGQLRACYKGVPLLVPEKGPVVAATLKNAPVK